MADRIRVGWLDDKYTLTIRGTAYGFKHCKVCNSESQLRRIWLLSKF